MQRSEIRGRFARAGFPGGAQAGFPGFHFIPSGLRLLRHGYAVYPKGRQLSVVARAFLDYQLGKRQPGIDSNSRSS